MASHTVMHPTEAMTRDLASFCKITDHVREQLTSLAPDEDATEILTDAWAKAYQEGSYTVSGNQIRFAFPYSDLWLTVTLWPSDGGSVPYHTAAARMHRSKPRHYESIKQFSRIDPDIYEQLARLAVSEPWGNEDEGKEILRDYLSMTFVRLADEDKIRFASDDDGEIAVFHTGLFTPQYEDIFCVCVPNPLPCPQGIPKWHLKGFSATGSGNLGKRIRRAFGDNLPPRACFTVGDSPAPFDTNLELVLDTEHIIRRTHRMSPEVHELLGAISEPLAELLSNVSGMGARRRESVIKNELTPRLLADAQLSTFLSGLVTQAAKRARARVRCVHTSALPAWDPRYGYIHLLPLCLLGEGSVDCALVVTFDDCERPHYEGRTILDPKTAYCRARLVQPVDWTVLQTSLPQCRNAHASLTAATGKSASSANVESVNKAHFCDSQTKPSEIRQRKPICKLIPQSEEFPSYLVHNGDTIGILRSTDDAIPSIVLPQDTTFMNVSQVQGSFKQAHDSVVFTQLGRNWTRATRSDGARLIARRGDNSLVLTEGDLLEFSGSVPFRVSLSL